MKNKYLIPILFLLILKSTTGYGTKHTVSANGSQFAFSPDSISANVGDTIVFVLAGIHSALEVSQSTWSAGNSDASNGGFAVPFGGGQTVVTQAKTYYYVCQNHYSMGMNGRIFVSIATGVPNLVSSTSTLEVYPNPVTNKAIVKTNLPAGKTNELRIFDVAGKCIYHENNVASSYSFDMTAMPSGVYFLIIKSDDVFLEKKLIVSK
jgi:plastocyanin